MGQYYAGNPVTLQAVFTSGGSLVTPTTVSFIVGGAGLNTTVYTYPATVSSPSAGTYTVVINTTGYLPGDYAYRVVSTGTGASSNASYFTVLADPV